MPQTEIVLFREESGRVPVLEWLDRLPARAQERCGLYLKWLEMKGHELRRPHGDHLRDGIYELRPSCGNLQYRILYFFSGRQVVVLSHGIRKEGKVPPAEIERAIARRTQFVRDPARHSSHRPSE